MKGNFLALTGVASLAALGLGFSMILAAGVGANGLLGASGAGFITVGLLYAIASTSRNRTFFHPLVLLSLPFLLGFALRPLYLMSLNESDLNAFLLGFPVEVMESGALLLVLFVATTVLGFLAFARAGTPAEPFRILRLRPTQTLVGRLLLLGYGSIAFSLIGLVLYLSRLGLDFGDLTDRVSAKRRIEVSGTSGTSFGSLGYYLWASSASGFVFVILMLAKVRLRNSGMSSRNQRRLNIVTTLCILVASLRPIITSSRADIMVILAIGFAVHTVGGRNIQARQALVVLLTALMVFVTIGTIRERAPLAVGRTAETVLGTHSWAGPAKAGIIIDAVPDRVEFQNGNTFLNLIYAPIPRTIWPNKPTVRAGKAFAEDIFQLGRSGRTGAPPGLPGELYLNFGLIGVVAGGVLFGGILRTCHSYASRSIFGRGSDAIALLVSFNLAVRLPGGDFVGIAVNTLMSSALLAIAAYLAFPKADPSDQELATSHVAPRQEALV